MNILPAARSAVWNVMVAQDIDATIAGMRCRANGRREKIG